jgi:hypothetical protein
MNKAILVAVSILGLGTSASFAQGIPPDNMLRVYGSKAFAAEPYHEKTVFSEILGRVKNKQAAAQHEVNSPKGG